LPKTPRPGSRTPPHKVCDNETLETVANRYGVPVKQLVLHNFGTLDSAEINWYLREFVGCTLATNDKKNWRFSSSAKPGLIYIPLKVLSMDPLLITGSAQMPVDLAAIGGPPEFLASEKFVYEFKIPAIEPADLGYFIAQARVSVEGELKQQGGFVKTQIKKGEIKVALEKKLTETTKGALSVKFDQKVLNPIADAVLNGSKGDFIKALAAPFEATLKTTYKWGNVVVEPELGLEGSRTPVIVRLLGGFEGPLVVEGTPFSGKFAVKIGFNVGLSAKGWAWVISKVGPQAVSRFLASCGRGLVAVGEWLVAAGVLEGTVIVGGALIGTLALTALMAKIVNDAHRNGELLGLSTWYASAYIAKVFNEKLELNFITGDTNLRAELIRAGEKDAVTDARATLAKANYPAANSSDQVVLDVYRQALLNESNGKDETAKWKLRQVLDAKAKKMVGL
jgi:hypothetical protein